jgi:hypothetical protein
MRGFIAPDLDGKIVGFEAADAELDASGFREVACEQAERVTVFTAQVLKERKDTRERPTHARLGEESDQVMLVSDAQRLAIDRGRGLGVPGEEIIDNERIEAAGEFNAFDRELRTEGVLSGESEGRDSGAGRGDERGVDVEEDEHGGGGER